jgi:hypothetical protein
MSLTLRAYGYGTAATVSDPGSIEHTHRPIMLRASLLWIKWCSLPTTQRAVRLGEKVVSPKLPTRAARAHCGGPKDGPAREGSGDGKASG